jgi:precorrin-3B methylase
MACSKCKKKEERERMEKEIIKNEKMVIVFMISLGIASVYGVYSLITKFL